MPVSRFSTLDEAVDWCSSWIALRSSCTTEERRLAAVFDIDATLVEKDERIEPVCALLERCRALSITPFFVTARSEEGRDYTERQLRKLGIGGHKRLFMHPSDVPSSAAGRIKQQARQRIEHHGYAVCLNAGDALHDHFHPTPPVARHELRHDAVYAFVTTDAVAHLKPAN